MKPGAIHEIESLIPPGNDASPELVLVLHDDEAFLHESPMVLVVPLIVLPADYHGHPMIKITATPITGLKSPMVAVLDRLHGVDRARIGARVGEVDRNVLIDVYRVLDRLIGRAPPARPGPSHSGDTRRVDI